MNLVDVVTRVFCCVLLIPGVGYSGYSQEPGFRLEGEASRYLPVTGRKMTNVIFPVEIAAGVRVSRDVFVQKVHGVENVIGLKALKRDFAPTSLAVYGKDGRLYSFVVHYVEDTSVLDYRVVTDGKPFAAVRLTEWPVSPEQLRVSGRILAKRKRFLHLRAADDRLSLRLKGTYLKDSLLWLSLEVRERSEMPFQFGLIELWSEDRKPVRRMASQRLVLSPVFVDGVGPIPARGLHSVMVALPQKLIARGKRLVVKVSDEDGDRELRLYVSRKMLLRARK
jgi:hypothetical protein